MATLSDSPLWMVTKEPRLTELVTHLLQIKQALMRELPPELELQFSRTNLEMVRDDFAKMTLLINPHAPPPTHKDINLYLVD